MGVTRADSLPVSAPVRVRDRLAGAPDGPVPVLHRGDHAVYVDLGGCCVGVVDPLAAAVPCALRSARTGVPESRTAEVRSGVLHLDGQALVVGRYVDTRAPGLRVAADRPAPLTTGEVRRLVGAGDGLTPYGDDVLCGWLAAHRAAGIATPEVDTAVRALAHRTTLLSAALLDCAMHGEVLPEFAAWLRSLGTADEHRRAAALASVGHSSGRGLLAGARRALLHLRPLRAVA